MISSSVADTQPVFDKHPRAAASVCSRRRARASILVGDDGLLRRRAFERSASSRNARSHGPSRSAAATASATAQAIRERRVVHFADVHADPGVPERLRRIARATGSFSHRAVAPMLCEGRGVGAIFGVARPSRAVQRQGGRPCSRLRRPGRDRDPERAPVQRDQGGARAADRDRGGAPGHQQLGRRHPAGVRQDPRQLRAPVRGERAGHLPCRRRRHAAQGGFRGTPRAADARRRRHFPASARRHGHGARDKRAPRRPLRRRARRPERPEPLRRIAAKAGNFSIAFAPMLWEGRGVGAIQVSRDPCRSRSAPRS